MPTWSTPATRANNDIMTAAIINQQWIQNSLFLKNRPFANVVMSAIVNTTSTSFTELTESRITITTQGGNILMGACGIFSNSTVGTVNSFDLAIDGTRQGDATVGLTQITTPSNGFADNLSVIFPTVVAPSTGAHVCSLYWKVSANTGSILIRFFALEDR
jgi:hypothetical protein